MTKFFFFLILATSSVYALQQDDYIVAIEPPNNAYGGINWGISTYMTPYYLLQRGMNELEFSLLNNFNVDNGLGSMSLRFIVGTVLDFQIYILGQNYHHALGHDANARELSWGFGYTVETTRRFTQFLPFFLGGEHLKDGIERISFGNMEAQAWHMTQPMAAAVELAYSEGRKVLANNETADLLKVRNLLFYRLRYVLLDWVQEFQNVEMNQSWFDGTNQSVYSPSGKRYPTDFTSWLQQLNVKKYGVPKIEDFKIGMNDIGVTLILQSLDPLWLIAWFSYFSDYVIAGKSDIKVPAIPIVGGLKYLPSLRTYFSPFGIEYFIDNYFILGGSLMNLFIATGDNRYERRLGIGFDWHNIKLFERVFAGLTLELYDQPALLRLRETDPVTPLTAAELHQNRLIYNFEANLKFPLFPLMEGKNPSWILAYVNIGYKNEGWIPKQYILGGPYMQFGLGLHL